MVTRNLEGIHPKIQSTLRKILRETAQLQAISLTVQQRQSVQRMLQAGQQLLQTIEYSVATLISNSNNQSPLATSPSARPTSINVLLVEDMPVIQHIHTMMLQELGCHVDVASSGAEALARFNKHYDMVLMDVGLPDFIGIEVTTKIRALEQEQTFVPIIMLTSQSDDALKEACFQAGANEFLTKPVLQKQLNEVIQQWVEIKQS